MTTTYLKLPITFDITSSEDKKNAEISGQDPPEEDEEGFIYVLIEGNSVIYSFNEHTDVKKTSIKLYDGSCNTINLTLDKFIDKLKSAGCKIIE